MPGQKLSRLGACAALVCAAPVSAQVQTLSAEDAASMREEIRALKAQIARMEQRLGGASGPAPDDGAHLAAAAPPKTPEVKPATIISWKGSPQFTNGDRSFKVKGRIQADAGYVSHPKGSTDQGLGFASEMRRIRLGGEGRLGAGIGYKLELELSDNAVDLVDTFVTYQTRTLLVTLGNHNQFQSLDELTGDTTGSFMERAAFTDAFNFERRLGLSAQYHKADMLLQAGIFTDDIGALSNANDGPAGGDENNSFSIDGRAVYDPVIGGTQIHLAGSAHWRRLKRIGDAPVRYRQRPYLHSSNSRVLATPNLSVDNELNYGVEAAVIHGPWHAAAEGHWLKAFRPGLGSVTFFGGYAEAGYFLTKGDSRSYKNGFFGGTDPHKPLGGGGIGAVQVNLRYDYLTLDDGAVRGGKQNAYLAAIIWTPINNLRFNLNYGYLRYDHAALLVNGSGNYDLHVTGARMELDF